LHPSVLIKRRPHHGVILPLLLVALAGTAAGCANLGDSMVSGAFVNPAKYDLYDCARLDTERKSLVAQADEKQKLIEKARGGVGGVVIGEAVYRNDYIALRAQKKLADEAWQTNSCDATNAPAAPVVAPAAASAAPPAAAAAPGAASRAAPMTARGTGGLY
jgi:hypothetical protein